MAAPQLLYKYEAFSLQSLENLKNQVIYFGSPKNFNDPYDCALCPSIAEPSDEDVERIRAHYLAQAETPEALRRKFQRATVSALRVIFLRSGQSALDEHVQKFLSQNGVSCFAERPNNLLMWSHYAEHHKGFCLEFRTDTETFQKLLPVKYKAQMPSFDLVPMLCDNDYGQVLDLFCTKSSDWAYEREWRALHKHAGTAFTYESEALSGVYFGTEVSPSMIEVIALVLAGQNEKVKLWKGTRSRTKFAVDFEHFTYTSHIEAKRLGLR
jgi:hypothetical protein